MGCAGSKAQPKASPVRGVGRPEPAPAPELIPRVKLVLLGDSGVGKSCLVLRYVRGQFDPSSKVTVGAAFMSHSVHLPDNKTVKFEIWDTAGQERYASLAPLYYRGASAAAIVYDITSTESFAKAKHWISELHRNASGDIVIILVGNKSDLVEHREVSEDEGKELAERHSMLFIETSAKTAANVSTVFETLAKKLAGYSEPVPSLPESAPAPSPQLPASTKAAASRSPPTAKSPAAPRSRATQEQPPQGDGSPRQEVLKGDVTETALKGDVTKTAASKAAAGSPSDKASPASDAGRQDGDVEQ